MTVWLAAVTMAGAVLVAAGRSGPGQRLVALSPPPRDGPSRQPRWDRGATLLAATLAGTVVAAARLPIGVPVVAVIAAVVVRRVGSARRSARHREAVARAVVEVTAGLAAEVRTGRSPAQALAAIAPWSGPLQPALSSAAAAVAAGLPAADALRLAAAAPGAESLRQVAAAWRVTAATGGRLAAVLDRLTDSLDAERELREELDSALAGPRATVVLLAGLPLMGLALGQAVGAHPLRLLLYRPFGWALLTAAALLDTAGVVVMARITRWATRW